MSMFRLVHLRHLRRQPLRLFLATGALAAAVAVSVVATVAIASLERSRVDLLRELAGPAPLRVSGPTPRGGIEPGVIDAVAATDGVEAAVPAVQAVAFAHSAGGERSVLLALGLDCRVEALIGPFQCDESAIDPGIQGPVLISPSLADRIGADGVIRTDTGEIPLGDPVRNDNLEGANEGFVAVFALEAAQRLFDRGHNVDAIHVVPSDGMAVDDLAERLRGVVGDHNMVQLRDEIPVWLGLIGPLNALLALVVLLGVGLSGLLVYNIVSLSLAERRRDLAIVSAVGTSPPALARNLLGEAAVLGLIGGIIGIPIGALLARPIIGEFASVVMEQASGLHVTVYVPPFTYAVALAIGVLTAVGAALIPARRSTRLDLSSELHGRGTLQETEPGRSAARILVLVGLSLAAVAASLVAQRNGAIEPWQPTLGGLALATSAVLVFAAAGALAPVVLRWLLSLVRGGGVVRMAVANLTSQPRRTSVIASAVAAAVGMGCVLGSLIPAIEDTVSSSDLAHADGRVFTSSLPLNNATNVDARLAKEKVAEIAEIDGVASVDETRFMEVGDVDGTYHVVGVEGAKEHHFPLVMGEEATGVLASGEGMIGTSLARTRGLRPGDTLAVATPSGFVDVRVGGIWIYSNNNGYSITVPMTTFERMFGAPAPHSVLVRPEAGVTVAELAARVEDAGIDPYLEAMTPEELSSALAAEISLQVSPFRTMQFLLLFVALVGTLSTLLLVGVHRRRELGILGAVGFGPRALGRMTLSEALAGGAVGALLGAVGSTAVFETLRNAAATSVGTRPPFRFDATSAAIAVAIALAVVVIGGALPAWRTSRLQIVDAIRDE